MTTVSIAQPLDARVWLLWGAVASLPLLTGRHPVILFELMVIVVVVRSVCLSSDNVRSWGWLVRISALAIPIGILFNMFTVHAGNQQMFHIPEQWPIVGGTVTWNAAAYGLLSGITIVVLVAVGTTIAAAIEWSALMRLLPARASGLAVAGSVAWSFLPQLARSWQDIRETQAARGHQWRGVRDFVPLMIPLLAGGLDRSIVTAEVLETRGFGVHAAPHRTGRFEAMVMIGSITAAVAALYLFAIGESVIALGVTIMVGALTLAVYLKGRNSQAIRPTHYRRISWTRRDSAVAAGALIALMAIGAALQVAPASLRYQPYPDISAPETQPLVIMMLAGLLIPAFVAPAPSVQGSEA